MLFTALAAMTALTAQPSTLSTQASPSPGAPKAIAQVAVPQVLKLIDEAKKEPGLNARVAILEAAARMALDKGDREGHGLCLVELARSYHATRNWDRELTLYTGAAAEFRAAGDQANQASALAAAAGVCRRQGSIAEAKQHFSDAALLYERLGKLSEAAHTLRTLTLMLFLSGSKPAEMVPLAMKSTSLFEASDAQQHKAQSLLLSAVLFMDSNPTRSGATFQQLRSLAIDLGDEELTLMALTGYLSVRPADSADFFALRQCLVQWESVGDLGGLARTHLLLARIYILRSDYEPALRELDSAKALFHKVGHLANEARCLSGAGAVYEQLGAPDEASKNLQSAIPLFEQVGDVAGMADSFCKLGGLYLTLESPQQSATAFGKAIESSRKSGKASIEAYALNGASVAYKRLRQYKLAAEKSSESAKLSRKLLDVTCEAAALVSGGDALNALGEEQAALESYMDGLALACQVGNEPGAATTLRRISNVFETRHGRPAAVLLLKMSVLRLHNLRKGAVGLSGALQESYRASMAHAYWSLYEALVAQGRFAEADRASSMVGGLRQERNTRGGGLARQLDLSIELTPKERYSADALSRGLEELKSIGNLIMALKVKPQRTVEEDARMVALTQEYAQKLAVYKAGFTTMAEALKGYSPSPEEVRLFEKPGNVSTVCGTLTAKTGLPTAALTTMTTDTGTVCVLTLPDGSHEVYRPTSSRADLARKCKECLALLQSRTSDPREATASLLSTVTGPLLSKARAKRVKVLMLSLDGALKELPWEALWYPESGHWLAEEFWMPRFNPAWGERVVESASADWKVAAFGNDRAPGAADIPGALAEARAVAGQTRGDAWVGGAAFTAESFLLTMSEPKYNVAHVASHFHIEPGSDAKSVLYCSGGKETVSLSQLRNDNEKGFPELELLVLSACATGVDNGDGAGIEGLTGTKLHPGPKSVLASLWSVDDVATKKLMVRFYALRAEHKEWTKLQCLATAESELRNGGLGKPGDAGWRGERLAKPMGGMRVWKGPGLHPYYWAPFVLYGNWM